MFGRVIVSQITSASAASFFFAAQRKASHRPAESAARHAQAPRSPAPRNEMSGRIPCRSGRASVFREHQAERLFAPFSARQQRHPPANAMKLKDGPGPINPECCSLDVVGSFHCSLSHGTNLPQCNAAGVEPSTPSDGLQFVSVRRRTRELSRNKACAIRPELRHGSAWNSVVNRVGIPL